MSRYFFNFINGATRLDDEGIELKDISAVRKEAIRATSREMFLREAGHEDFWSPHHRDECEGVIPRFNMLFPPDKHQSWSGPPALSCSRSGDASIPREAAADEDYPRCPKPLRPAHGSKRGHPHPEGEGSGGVSFSPSRLFQSALGPAIEVAPTWLCLAPPEPSGQRSAPASDDILHSAY